MMNKMRWSAGRASAAAQAPASTQLPATTKTFTPAPRPVHGQAAQTPELPPRSRRAPKTYPTITFADAMKLIESSCGNVFISERHGNGPNKVIILPEAARELRVMLSYGRRSPMNLLEQKYLGFGHFLTDDAGRVITIVSHFIEIQTMNRSAVGASNLGPNGEKNPGLDFLEYHREEFLRTEARCNRDEFGHQVDPFLKMCGSSEYVLEGHTHPDLGVFYSATDRQSGRACAASSPVCIFVCDPIRRKMLGSVGKDFAPAEVIVYSRRSDVRGAGAGAESAVRSTPQLSPIEELEHAVHRCACTLGCSEKFHKRTRADGRISVRMKLLFPKPKREGGE